MFALRVDPGEAAYFDIKGRVAKYQGKRGTPVSGGDPSEKSNALYYWKRAVQWGDEDAAQKWLKKYQELGGTTRGLRQSLSLAEPLSGIKGRARREFKESLSAEGKETLRMAEEWYDRVYRGARHTRLPRRIRTPVARAAP
jgi:hypothetical protein